MYTNFVFGLCLSAIGAGLLTWHVLAWWETKRTETRDDELAFAWRQTVRRMQASGMIAVLGVAVWAGDFIESPIYGLFYWSTVLLVVFLIGVLAMADLVAVQGHFQSERKAHYLEEARLRADLHREQTASSEKGDESKAESK